MANGLGRGWAAVVVWIAIQLTLTSLPGSSIPVNVKHPMDWVGHCGLYGGLGILVARVGGLRGWPWRHLLLAGLFITIGAALDELHQLLIPGRDAEVGDWVADALGAWAGLALGMRLMQSRLATWLR